MAAAWVTNSSIKVLLTYTSPPNVVVSMLSSFSEYDPQFAQVSEAIVVPFSSDMRISTPQDHFGPSLPQWSQKAKTIVQWEQCERRGAQGRKQAMRASAFLT